jgi:hypothetical protein
LFKDSATIGADHREEGMPMKKSEAIHDKANSGRTIGPTSAPRFSGRIMADIAPDERVKRVHAFAHALRDASGNREFVGAVTDDKRAGGTGLISGRKAFQRPLREGIQLLNTIQDVYLSPEVTIA